MNNMLSGGEACLRGKGRHRIEFNCGVWKPDINCSTQNVNGMDPDSRQTGKAVRNALPAARRNFLNDD